MEKEIKQEEQILNDMLFCNAACAGDFQPVLNEKRGRYEATTYLAHNLPSFSYIRSQMINYLFSDGLTTGNDKQTETLNNFLYANNIQGETNYSVLQNAVSESLTYGRCGLRFLSLEDGLINVSFTKYAELYDDNTEYYGFRDTLGYIVSITEQKIWDMKLSEMDINFDLEELKKKGVIVDKDRNILILSKEEMTSIHYGSFADKDEGVLDYDKQRTKMLASVYERLTHDIEYDGPGRIMLRLKDAVGGNDVSTSEVVNNSIKDRRNRKEKAQAEVGQLAKEIKDSNSDNVILLSNMFDENVTHLPRVTKATEFLELLQKNEDKIIAELFGAPPSLFGVGEIAGNISMEKIIDNAMLNVIIPIREKFAIQFSSFLSPKLGVEKIYFDKYNMQQAEDENGERTKIVDMIVKLKGAGYDKLADKFAGILDNDISLLSGIKSMSVTIADKIKKLFNRGEKNHGRNNAIKTNSE